MLPTHLQVTERNRLTNDFEHKILKLNSRVDDGKLMKPKEATTIMDMSNEFYNFLFSQVAKLELKLPESTTQDMFNSLNN
jgi:hypothetical protein